MKRNSRLSPRRVADPSVSPSLDATPDGAPGEATSEGTNRRGFLTGSAGVAASTALILATPPGASAAIDAHRSRREKEAKAVVVKSSGPMPSEPVTAMVRNAKKGEVTVMSGSQEVTYKDPALVKRLLQAAR